MWIEVLATVLGLVYLAIASEGVSGAGHVYYELFDVPSLIAILILTTPVFFKKGMWTDFKNAVKLQRGRFSCSLGEMKKAQYAIEFIQKQILYAGVITLLYGLISVLNNNAYPGADMDALAVCLSIALVCPLYAGALELLFLPLEIGVKRRIAEYMEEE